MIKIRQPRKKIGSFLAFIFWRLNEAFIVNARTKNRTLIHYKNWRINRKFPSSLFSPRSLDKKIDDLE